MAKSIRNLELGSKVKDSKGNIFTVIAHNHYEANETVLMATKPATSIKMHANTTKGNKYENSEVDYYLRNNYSETLDASLLSVVKETPIQVLDKISNSQNSVVTIRRKYFTLSACEMDYADALSSSYTLGNKIEYFNSTTRRIIDNVAYWTRMQSKEDNTYWIIEQDGYISYRLYNNSFGVVPAFTVGNVLVSDNVTNGCYSFVFNEPPVIQNINNINGNYGSATNISYVATDNDDSELTHYISFDNGTKWQEIKPTRSGNIYTYSHVFNELNTFYCRIKVVDSANNEVVSNAFTITVNALAPTVNIVSVVDKVITFKTNCITSEVSKVEIIINGKVVKTFTNGFDFNLIYEIDRNNLNIGKNSIQIKATSQENLVGYANLEASKTKYNLPPVGTKVIINGVEYSISNASENGSNQTYTLNNNLINQVKKGDTVQVTQDLVKVLCSMSNLENSKNYKEMKLVKTKKLKGDFEGYVEEKYELQGDGRYSTIKLEMQRFNNNVSTEILELQQYFDYLED